MKDTNGMFVLQMLFFEYCKAIAIFEEKNQKKKHYMAKAEREKTVLNSLNIQTMNIEQHATLLLLTNHL